MIVYPAIDLRQGRVVRLAQGRLDAETVYGEDPAAVARRWAGEGAAWLHVVNLDGAFGSESPNLQALRAILDAVAIPIQFGGGLRSLQDIAGVIEMGITRAVLGTVAVERPDIVLGALDRWGAGQIAVAIDARDGQVATRGWLETSTMPALALGQRLKEAGIERVIYTDIARDGMLSGINVEATRLLAETCGLRVIASGGVASLADVEAARALEPAGVDGLIAGRALYTGALRLADALAVAGGSA